MNVKQIRSMSAVSGCHTAMFPMHDPEDLDVRVIKGQTGFVFCVQHPCGAATWWKLNDLGQPYGIGCIEGKKIEAEIKKPIDTDPDSVLNMVEDIPD